MKLITVPEDIFGKMNTENKYVLLRSFYESLARNKQILVFRFDHFIFFVFVYSLGVAK